MMGRRVIVVASGRDEGGVGTGLARWKEFLADCTADYYGIISLVGERGDGQ